MSESSGAGASARPRVPDWIVGAGLAVTAFAAHLPALANGFVNWDDPNYVTTNPFLGRFDAAYVWWSFTTWWHLNWHPVTWLVYGLEHALFGKSAFGYHLVNLLLHAANTALVFRVAVRLFARSARSDAARRFGAVVAAGLFAVHPLHVESVAWVSECKDLLYTAFSLLATLRYLDYVEADRAGEQSGRRSAYLQSLALFALGAMAKPMAVTLPVVLLILDAYPLARLRGTTARALALALEKLPYFAISLAVSWLTVLAQRAGGAIKLEQLSLFERALVALRALGFYLAKFVAPAPLVPLYPLPEEISPIAGDTLAALVAVVVISVLAIRWRRRRPVLAACWAFYVVTLLPVLGLIQVGDQAAADRYSYFPILGPSFLLASGAAMLFDLRPGLRRALLGTAVVVMLLLGLRSAGQTRVWSDSFSLWRYVLLHHPDSVAARYNLGHAYLEVSDGANAELWFQRTLEVAPRHTPALNELGRLATSRSAFDESLSFYLAAIESAPTYPIPHFNAAQLYERAGDPAAARRHYELFLRFAGPEHAQAAASVRAKLGRR